MKLVEPRDVAQAIVGALVRPRSEVFVPAYMGYLLKAQSVLTPGMRRAMAKLSGPTRWPRTSTRPRGRHTTSARRARSPPRGTRRRR